ncbi:MAG: FAD-dependent oxidoreductase, partial [Mariprofundales bacterium]
YKVNKPNKPNKSHKSHKLSADIIILATGSRPRRPSHVPFDKKTVLDSTSILKMQHLPRSLTVIGGGVIACEFISIFAALGVAVTVIDKHKQVLAYLSNDVTSVLTDAMQAMGVEFHMRHSCTTIKREADGRVTATLDDDRVICADALLYAQGRQANARFLHLERSDIELDSGWIKVNDYFQTSQPHIYAIGDLIGHPALAATGMEQGRIAALHAFGANIPDMAINMPMAIYTIPELSSVGSTEKELKQKNITYVVGRGWFKESARGQIIGDTTGMLKINVGRDSRKILGIHIVGESASELIHIGQLLMNMQGTVDDLASNVFNYPTLAECYKLAATDCLQQLSAVGG